MCVIVHKPAGHAIPPALLAAIASLNRDGWGLMGFDARGELLLERHAHVDLGRLIETEARLRDAEYALHLRLLTRGSTDVHNIHPIRISDDHFLMHNGTLCGIQIADVRRSDTWHLASNVLRPLLERDPGIVGEPAFLRLLEMALGVDNKAVLLQRRSRRLHILNRDRGIELEGLWCSNTRWIDQRLYTVPTPAQPQERSRAAEQLHFI